MMKGVGTMYALALLCLAGRANAVGRSKEPQHPIFHFSVSEKKCAVSPENFDDRNARFFLVECAPDVKEVTISFEDEKKLGKDKQQYIFDYSEDIVTEVVAYPQDALFTGQYKSCADPQNLTANCDVYSVEVRGGSDEQPRVDSVVFAKEAPESTYAFDTKQPNQNVKLFSNEPITVTAQAGRGFFVDSLHPLPESLATDRSKSWMYTPTVAPGMTEQFNVFVTNEDRSVITNYTFNVETVTSINPRLAHVDVHPGRLDPIFRSHHYTYFARVPEDAKSVQVKWDAINRHDTKCEVFEGAIHVGHGVVTVHLPEGFTSQLVHINCVAQEPSYRVQYVIEVVSQKGGSTMLKELDVIGAELDRPFDPFYSGPYQVDLCFQKQKDLNWVAFLARPFNDRAVVHVEGQEFENSTLTSPYFNVRLGEVRRFRVGVRTPENPVEEEYFIDIDRCARKSETYSYARESADSLGYISSLVSSVRGLFFIHNAKFLQFLSMTNRLNGIPESYEYYTDGFNKFNLQCDLPGVKMKRYPRTPDNSTFHYPPEQYAHMMSYEMEAISEELEHVIEHASHTLLSYESEGSQVFADHEIYKDTVREVVMALWNEKLASGDAEDPASPIRSLLPLKSKDKRNLMSKLDGEAKTHRELLHYSSTFVLTTAGLITMAMGYAALWTTYLKAPGENFLNIRQDFPQWLAPTRFWTFVLDFGLISYTQCAVGLIFLFRKRATVQLFFLPLTPKLLFIFCIMGLVVFPIAFIGFGAFMLYKIRGDVVWSKTLNRHHDKPCYQAKAYYRFIHWLPVISNFLTIEVKSVVPISRTPEDEGAPAIVFNNETNEGGPWMTADPQAVIEHRAAEKQEARAERKEERKQAQAERAEMAADMTEDEVSEGARSDGAPSQHSKGSKSSKPSQGPSAQGSGPASRKGQASDGKADYEEIPEEEDIQVLKYDSILDRVRVEIDETTYTHNLYDNKNAAVMKRWGRATVGYNTYGLKNAYDVPCDLEVQVQIRHLMPLMQALDSYTLWVPRDGLELDKLDKWNNLFGKAHRGGFFSWAIDRMAIFVLIFILSIWQDNNGIIQTIVFGVVCAALGALHVPPAMAHAAGKWHKAMEQQDEKNREKEEAKEAIEASFNIWPYKEETVKEQFKVLRQQKIDKKWCGLYGPARQYVFEPVSGVLDQPFWLTRTWFTMKEIIAGPPMVEMVKVLILANLLLGNRRLGLFGNVWASFWAISLTWIGSICLNYEAYLPLWRQMTAFLYESFVWTRRGTIFLVDAIKNAVSPNFISVRDFTIFKVKLIQNEFGMHMPANARLPKSEKFQFMSADALDKRRFRLHKTLYRVGEVGAFREDIDRVLPVTMPLKQLYNKADALDRLAGTIQIVNHTKRRYGQDAPMKHTADDDSYLSLFTDPEFVPECGDIKDREGHGYAVRYDRELNQLFIRGPGIIESREYTAKTVKKDDNAEADDTKSTVTTEPSEESDHFAGNGFAEAYCTDAGVLTVTVPAGQTPNLYDPFEIKSPYGDSFRVDPNVVKIVYDKPSRHLYLRARGIAASRDPYTITWTIKENNVPVKGKGVAHAGGVLVIQLEGKGVPNLFDKINLRDDTDAVVIVDPRLNDAHQVVLPHPRYNGFVRFLYTVSTLAANLWHFIIGRQVLVDVVEEPIPCTVVQCTNPVEKVYRVEPNFHETAKSLNAKIEETQAKLDALDDPQQLGVVCFSVMTSGEFANFFKTKGVEVEANGRWINPLMDATHPLFREKYKQIRDVEPQLRAEVESRLKNRYTALNRESEKLKVWIKAYSSPELYAAQLERDNADYRTEEVDEHIKTLRMMKQHYEQELPSSFVYPMNVDHRLISARPNVEAQMLQWRHRVEQWLVQEENASRGGLVRLGNTHYECMLSEVMRALEITFNRAENMRTGMFRTALHFVANSVAVRGNDFTWRPDPLCAHPAWVRAWQATEDGQADFDREPIWLPCSLKLTGSSVKIMMPNVEDAERDFQTPHDWKRVTGWYVPHPAFEKIEVLEDSSLPAGAHPQLKTTDCKLVCRKNQHIHVDDNFIRRIEDDQFDNIVTFISPVTNERQRCCLMIGHCVDPEDAPNWPATERDASIHGEKVNVHPLLFRLNSAFYMSWHSALSSAGMGGAPMDTDKDFDGHARPESEESEPLPESEPSRVSSSYETYESSDTPEPEPEPMKGHYKVDWFDHRYSGKGQLHDKNGKLKYDGDFVRGVRWGKGKAWFTDRDGSTWCYEGEFANDEPSGKGKLSLDDDKEVNRLSSSSNAEDRSKITSCEGVFRPTRPFIRTGSFPNNKTARSSISQAQMADLHGADHQEELAFDVRRVHSAGADDVNAATVGAVSECYGVGTTSAPSETTTKEQEELAQRGRFAREIDPNLGYETVRDRFVGGKMGYADGTSYKGDMKDGKPHGEGLFYCARCPLKYLGSWNEGRPHGQGVLEYGTNDQAVIYHGHFNDGKRHGKGALLCNGGTIFMEGTWADDSLESGACKTDVAPIIAERFPYRTYVGDMNNCIPDGEGKFTWADGCVYEGFFKDGLRHGQGTMFDAEGNERLTGTWEKDLPSGRVARMVLPGGQVYSGDVSKGQRNGMGEIFKSEKGGAMYEGLWLNDLPNGRGTFYAPDGEYDGEWKNGKRSGKGRFTYKNNPQANGKARRYEGDWREDKQHGIGKYLDENGLEATYQFTKGELSPQSVQAYKQTCGSAPKMGAAATVCDGSSFKAVTPLLWGKAKSTNPKDVENFHRSQAVGIWAKHEAKPFEYRQADESEEASRPPSTIAPTGVTVGGAGPKPLLTVQVIKALGVPVIDKLAGGNHLCRVKVARRSKATKPSMGKGENPEFNADLRFLFRDSGKITFELWDTLQGEAFFVAGATYDATDRLQAREQIEDQVTLMRGGKEAGFLTFKLFVKEEDKTPSIAQTSSASGYPMKVAKSLSGFSDLQPPVGSHVKCMVHSATGLPGTKDMDPYVRITCGTLAHQTRHRPDGGHNPKFDEPFHFTYVDQTEVKFEVFDLLSGGTDKLVGVGTIPLDGTTRHSGAVPLKKGDAKAGNLNVSVVVDKTG